MATVVKDTRTPSHRSLHTAFAADSGNDTTRAHDRAYRKNTALVIYSRGLPRIYQPRRALSRLPGGSRPKTLNGSDRPLSGCLYAPKGNSCGVQRLPRGGPCAFEQELQAPQGDRFNPGGGHRCLSGPPSPSSRPRAKGPAMGMQDHCQMTIEQEDRRRITIPKNPDTLVIRANATDRLHTLIGVISQCRYGHRFQTGARRGGTTTCPICRRGGRRTSVRIPVRPRATTAPPSTWEPSWAGEAPWDGQARQLRQGLPRP